MPNHRYRKSRSAKPKKSILKTRSFWIFLVIIAFIVFLAYLVLFHDLFQIKEITISGNEKLSKEKIESIILMESEKNLLAFKTNSIFLVSKDKITKSLFNNYAEIEDVNIALDYPSALLIKITERKPYAIFCQNQKISSQLDDSELNTIEMPSFVISKDSCFYLDESGVAFEAILKDANSFFIEVPSYEGIVKVGDKIVPSEDLVNVIKIENFLRSNLKIGSNFAIISNKRVDIETEDGFNIYLNLDSDIDWQLTKLSLVLKEEIPQERKRDLEYIDVRHANFAPYKYKNNMSDVN